MDSIILAIVFLITVFGLAELYFLYDKRKANEEWAALTEEQREQAWEQYRAELKEYEEDEKHDKRHHNY